MKAVLIRHVGIGKSTFHYLRQNTNENQSFRVYEKVRRRLEPAG